MIQVEIKRVYTLLVFGLIAFVCKGQCIIDGQWYLHEVQIPFNEEYDSFINYDKNKCIILINRNEDAVEWTDFEPESLEEPVEIENDDMEDEDIEISVGDAINWWEAINVDLEKPACEDVLYDIYNDSVLVMNPSEGMYDVYIIKELSKDRLVFIGDRQNLSRLYVVDLWKNRTAHKTHKTSHYHNQ